MNLLSFGEFLKCKREKQKLGRTEFGRRYGMTYNAIWVWETNVSLPGKKILPAVIKAYGLTQDDCDNYNLDYDPNQANKSITQTIPLVTKESILRKAENYKKYVNLYLNSNSAFEQGLIYKVNTVIKRIEAMLSELSIIDEAIQSYRDIPESVRNSMNASTDNNDDKTTATNKPESYANGSVSRDRHA